MALFHIGIGQQSLAGVEEKRLIFLVFPGQTLGPVAAQLQHLFAGLGDAAGQPLQLRTGVADVTEQGDLVVPAPVKAVLGDQALVEQLLKARQFVLHQCEAVVQCILLRGQTFRLLRQLVNPLFEDLPLAFPHCVIGSQQGLLRRQNRREAGIVHHEPGEFRARGDGIGPVHFGSDTGLAGEGGGELVHEDAILRRGHGIGQFDQNLPGFHVLALDHLDLADQPAFEVLDDGQAALHAETTCGDYGALDRSDGSPSSQRAPEHRGGE